MLRFLVPSRVRRRLLLLLWGPERARGSMKDLASRAHAALASVNVELRAMERELLVVSAREGGPEVFSANWAHPRAELLRQLVEDETVAKPAASDDDLEVKQKLKAMGAPLRGVEPGLLVPGEQLETLARGAKLARRDPVLARTLPVCVWKVRDALDPNALKALSLNPEEKHSLAFFLSLTHELSHDSGLRVLAGLLRDKRMKSVRPFFQPPPRRVDGGGGFPLAREWGFQMDMSLESFRSTFQKFTAIA